MKSTYALLSVAALLPLLPSAMGWGTEGHQIIASIAQIHLYPEVRQALSEILAPEYNGHLANVATWADTARNQPQWAYTADMHFVNAKGDMPAEKCVFGEQGWQSEDVNVITAIHNMAGQIYTALEARAMDIPLRFLTHYVGDMHQPLHLCARLRGGNDAKVNFDGKEKKLHGVWDGDIPKEFIGRIKNYTKPVDSFDLEAALPTSNSSSAKVNPYVRWVVWEGIREWWSSDIEGWISCPVDGDPFPVSPASSSASLLSSGMALVKAQMPFQHFFNPSPSASAAAPGTPEGLACPYHWAKEIHPLNCEVVWPQGFDESRRPRIEITDEGYMGKIEEEKLIEKLFAKAGVRLAKIINEAIGGEGYEGVYTGWQDEAPQPERALV